MGANASRCISGIDTETDYVKVNSFIFAFYAAALRALLINVASSRRLRLIAIYKYYERPICKCNGDKMHLQLD